MSFWCLLMGKCYFGVYILVLVILRHVFRVNVILEFTNKEQREVLINGKMQTMYVPFVVGMGTVIDNENNKNIFVLFFNMLNILLY